MKMYIVTAYRWGSAEKHSYNLGVFNDLEKAKEVAEDHCNYRGGKYECVVYECKLNHFQNDDDVHTKEIFRAKSLND